MSILVLCKFTPLGFETRNKAVVKAKISCKFTPLGFETRWPKNLRHYRILCKFTPLGFETPTPKTQTSSFERVNLPRWGLKQEVF